MKIALFTNLKFNALGLLVAMLLTALPPAWGMTANPEPFQQAQPDGSVVTLRMRGDQYFHWLEDGQGYTVLRDSAGQYVYAQAATDGSLASSGLAVGQGTPAAAGLTKGLLPSPAIREQRSLAMAAAAGPQGAQVAADAPVRVAPVGGVKNLVILCRFSDHTAVQTRTQADFDTIFNTVGGDATLAPTGSVRDYYSENSYGTMTLQSTVVAWVTLPQTEAYYANANDGLGSYPQNAQKMVEDALNLADPLVNFTQFDLDNDGFVDAIDIIHSGYAAETGGGGGNWIWSHKWALPSNWTSAESNGSGVRVKVRDYHTEPALWGTSGTEILRIGVVCHETGHFFGLPDLYDTDGTSQGIGSYCLMANSWGFDNSQRHPPHFSAWCKIQLGWVTPTVVSTGTFTAPRVAITPTIFKITQGYPTGEYLLVENRQPYGFESDLPQGGLCIWHIDEAKSSNTAEGYPGQAGWPGNNNHYKVALLQADGAYGMEHNVNRGDAADVYRGGGVSALTPTTTPNTNRYQNGVSTATGNSITNISVASASMSFTLNPPPATAPALTSPLNAAANAGSTFVYQITASNTPDSFSATGLPSGLILNSLTGLITGTPASSGTFTVTLGATNAVGTGTANLQLAVGVETAGRQTPIGWHHPWKYFQPMGTFPTAAGNFATTWFAAESTFTATYTGPVFGANPAVVGDPAVLTSFDSGVGAGPLGYGVIDYFTTVGAEFTEFRTLLSTPNSGSRNATYFRANFNVPGNALIKPMLRYLLDDGAFIYLDGQLVCTVNLATTATDTYTQLAANSTGTEDPILSFDPALPGPVVGGNATVVRPITMLSPGVHTLALSVHNNSLTSSDLSLALELTAENGPAVAHAALYGGATSTTAISSGDTTPATLDGTDFGSRNVSAGALDKSFLIYNTGSATLNLGTITSSGAQFSIPPGYASSVLPGASTTLTVRFTPVAGSYNSVITIPSNDAATPYTFTVAAVGVNIVARQTLVPWNHTWKYYHPMGALPAAPGNFLTTWFAAESTFITTYTGPSFGASPAVVGNPPTTTTFDSGSGAGPFGYDVMDYFTAVGAEFTAYGKALTAPLTNNRKTAYFRTTFTVPVGGLTKPQLRYLLDDGGFIYLDGTLLCTVNMAAGATDAYATLAANSTLTEASLRTVDLRTAGAVSGGNATVNTALTFLSAGTHTLAASAHNATATSTDLSAALELTAEPGCAINAVVANVVRADHGNSNPLDDTLSFTIIATGTNNGPTWSTPTGSVTSSYGVPTNFTGISVGNPPAAVPVTLTDAGDNTCQVTAIVPLPPYVGVNLATGGNIFLDARLTASGLTYDEVLPGLTVNNGNVTTQTQLIDLDTVNGALLLEMDLTARETSTTTNFETNDIVRAELVLNPGANQTTINLLDALDRNHDGFLNGYSGTTPEPYNSFPGRDEFNFALSPVANTLNHTFHLEANIPDAVTTARVVLTFINDSASEFYDLANFKLSVADPDTDQDGLDDAWERMWFGTITLQNGSGDPDADGISNAQEMLAGTRPNDPASHLSMDAVSTVGNVQTLTIATVPGRKYRLETAAALAATDWTPNGPTFTATAATTTRALTLPANRSRTFVRASIVAP